MNKKTTITSQKVMGNKDNSIEQEISTNCVKLCEMDENSLKAIEQKISDLDDRDTLFLEIPDINSLRKIRSAASRLTKLTPARSYRCMIDRRNLTINISAVPNPKTK